MHDTNRRCPDRHSDNAGWKVVMDRTPAIADLARSTRKFLAVVRRVL
jgi:hypothetical protein